jgi:hypothetical protein
LVSWRPRQQQHDLCTTKIGYYQNVEGNYHYE